MRFRISAFVLCLILLFNIAVFAEVGTESNAAAVFVTGNTENPVFRGSLKEAVNYANFNREYSHIEISGNITLDDGFTLAPNVKGAGTIIIRGNVTLDLNGKFCTQSSGDGESSAALFTVPKDGGLTVKDSSKSRSGTVNGVQFAVSVQGGELNIEGGTFMAQSQASLFPDTAEIPVKLTDGGKLLMRGGRIDYSGTLDDGREYSGENGAVFADETSALNIEGGTVNGKITLKDGNSITITGGRFAEDVSGLLENGYECEEKDGIYEIRRVIPTAKAYFYGEEGAAEVVEVTEPRLGYTVSAKSRTRYHSNTKIDLSEVVKSAAAIGAAGIRIETDCVAAEIDKSAVLALADKSKNGKKVYFSASKSETVSEDVLRALNTAREQLEYGFYYENDETIDIGSFKTEIPYTSKTVERNITVCVFEGKSYSLKDDALYKDGFILHTADGSEKIVIAEGAAVAIQGRALDLKGSVSLVFYARLDGIDADNARMLFWTSPQAEYTESTAERVVKTTGKTSLGYKFEFENIASKDMNTEIYARIAATDSHGKHIYGDEPQSGYSIVKYAQNMMNDEKLKPLLVKMLNYGAAAQEYFGSDATPANSILTEGERATDYTRIYTSGAQTIPEDAIKCNSEIKGKTISLDGDISINYYTSYRDGDGLEYGMLFWTENAYKSCKSHTIGTESYKNTKYEVNGDYIVFSYKNIVSSAMNDRIYARLYVRNGDSYAYGDIDSYSVCDYAANQITKNSDQKLIKLLRTLMLYGDEAKTYFRRSED